MAETTPARHAFVLTADLAPHISTPRRIGIFLLRNPSGLLGAAIVLCLVLSALFAPVLAPYDPLQMGAGRRLTPPSAAHLFGTDEFGRDLLSRVVYGSRLTLQIGLIAVGISLSTVTPRRACGERLATSSCRGARDSGPPGVDVDRFAPRERDAAARGVGELASRLRSSGSAAPTVGSAGTDAFARDELAAADALDRLRSEPRPNGRVRRQADRQQGRRPAAGRMAAGAGARVPTAWWSSASALYREGFERLCAALADSDVGDETRPSRLLNGSARRSSSMDRCNRPGGTSRMRRCGCSTRVRHRISPRSQVRRFDGADGSPH